MAARRRAAAAPAAPAVNVVPLGGRAQVADLVGRRRLSVEARRVVLNNSRIQALNQVNRLVAAVGRMPAPAPMPIAPYQANNNPQPRQLFEPQMAIVSAVRQNYRMVDELKVSARITVPAGARWDLAAVANFLTELGILCDNNNHAETSGARAGRALNGLAFFQARVYSRPAPGQRYNPPIAQAGSGPVPDNVLAVSASAAAAGVRQPILGGMWQGGAAPNRALYPELPAPRVRMARWSYVRSAGRVSSMNAWAADNRPRNDFQASVNDQVAFGSELIELIYRNQDYDNVERVDVDFTIFQRRAARAANFDTRVVLRVGYLNWRQHGARLVQMLANYKSMRSVGPAGDHRLIVPVVDDDPRQHFKKLFHTCLYDFFQENDHFCLARCLAYYLMQRAKAIELAGDAASSASSASADQAPSRRLVAKWEAVTPPSDSRRTAQGFNQQLVAHVSAVMRRVDVGFRGDAGFDVSLLADLCKELQINLVVLDASRGCAPVFLPEELLPSPYAPPCVLLLYSGHVFYVAKPRSLLNTQCFCYTCGTGHSAAFHTCMASMETFLLNRVDHRPDYYETIRKRAEVTSEIYGMQRCIYCDRSHKVTKYDDATELQRRAFQWCDDCGRYIHPDCVAEHHPSGNCSIFYTCDKCNKRVNRSTRGQHECTKTFCRKCHVTYNPQDEGVKHQCWLQPIATDLAKCSDPAKNNMDPYADFVVFDFETYVDDDNNHQVMWCSALTLSPAGSADADRRYRHYDTVEKFMLAEVLDSSRREDGVRTLHFLAHNGKGFDFHFIVRCLMTFTNDHFDVVKRGMKLMSVSIPSVKVKFLCTLNFWPMALRNLPKTFGFSTRKGFFPHELNRPDLDKLPSGDIPAIEHFSPNLMGVDELADLRAWHATRVRLPYNLFAEMVLYCDADVLVLAKACEAYIFLLYSGPDTLGVHPFLKCLTAASLSMKVFKSTFLEEQNRVAMLPYKDEQFFRRAFAGGDTQIYCHFVDADKLRETRPGFRIRYFDKVSMYPSVMRQVELPSGVPTYDVTVSGPVRSNYDASLKNLARADLEARNLFGFVELTLKPPPPERHGIPVLPAKPRHVDERLIFGYQADRMVDIVVDTPTLYTCLDHGYTYDISSVKRVVHWGPDRRSREVFTKFVDYFFNLKNEAKRAGNKGKESAAKLIINSLWGKLAQQSNVDQTVYLQKHERDQLHQLIASPLHTVTQVKWYEDSSDVVEVQYRASAEAIETGQNLAIFNNIPIAAFITASARLELFKGKCLIGEQQLIYCDTDSIVSWEDDEHKCPMLHEPSLLGHWADELIGQPEVSVFVALGPKTYGFKYADGRWKSRAKGIRQCSETESSLTFDTVVQILAQETDEVQIKQTRIMSVGPDHVVHSAMEIDEDADSEPSEVVSRALKQAYKRFGMPEQPKRLIVIPPDCANAREAMGKYGIIRTRPFV